MDYTAQTPPVAYCRICGKPLQAAEQRYSNGTVYCAEHVPAPAADPAGSPWTVPPTAPPPPPPPAGYLPVDMGVSPGLAFVLGLIPGVGAIYNAQYAKGLVHVVVFGLLISLVNADSGDLGPLFGMLIPTWVIYQAFEAYHTAKRRALGLRVDEFSSLMPMQPGRPGAPVIPVVLIGFGVLFLLHNFELLRLSQLLRFWPLALIGLGVYLLYVRLQEPVPPPMQGTTPEVGRE